VRLLMAAPASRDENLFRNVMSSVHRSEPQIQRGFGTAPSRDPPLNLTLTLIADLLMLQPAGLGISETQVLADRKGLFVGRQNCGDRRRLQCQEARCLRTGRAICEPAR
jgi:hypothetical protein